MVGQGRSCCFKPRGPRVQDLLKEIKFLKTMQNKRGIILTVVIIFMLTISIVTAISIVLMTNEARITESKVRRLRAFYTVEGGIVHAIEHLNADPTETNWTVPPVVLNATYTCSVLTAENQGAGTGPNSTRTLTSSVSY